MPLFVFLMTGFYAIFGLLALGGSWFKWRDYAKNRDWAFFPAPGLQCGVWAVLVAVSAGLAFSGQILAGLVFLLIAQFVPRWRKIG